MFKRFMVGSALVLGLIGNTIADSNIANEVDYVIAYTNSYKVFVENYFCEHGNLSLDRILAKDKVVIDGGYKSLDRTFIFKGGVIITYMNGNVVNDLNHEFYALKPSITEGKVVWQCGASVDNKYLPKDCWQ